MRNTTDKDTFWNDLRREKGVTLREMGAALNTDQATLSHYFTGMQLPSTPTSVKICDYFGIDYAIGAEEFNKAHEAWIAENPGSKKKRSHIRSRKFDVNNIPAEVSNVSELAKSLDVIEKCNTPSGRDSIMAKRDNILRLIYNKVDYDTYNEVVKVIDS